MFLLSGIPTVEKKNHHSWIEARHNSTHLYVSNEGALAVVGQARRNGSRARAGPNDLTVRASLGKFLEMHRFV
jgi:hypothetical protein